MRELIPFIGYMMLISNFENRELISHQSFMRELYGTRQHVESLMSVLGWSRPMTGYPSSPSAWSDVEQRPQPDAELFLWALLMGRAELAILFWRRQLTHFYCAIIAAFEI